MKPTEEMIDKFLEDNYLLKDIPVMTFDKKTLKSDSILIKDLIIKAIEHFRTNEHLLVANLMHNSNIDKLRATMSNGEFRRLVLKLGKEHQNNDVFSHYITETSIDSKLDDEC